MMDMKKLVGIFALLAVFGVSVSMPVSATYVANYTINDVDDILIDTMATGMVEIKDDMPTLVDLGVLYLIMSLLLLIVTGAIAIFYVIPKKLGMGKSKKI